MCASTHFLQTGHNISVINCTKVHEMFTRPRGFIGDVGMGLYYGSIFPTVVECQQTIWRRAVSVFTDTRHKSVIIATSLEWAIAIGIFCYKADLSLYICRKFGEDQSIDSVGNNANMCIFACAHIQRIHSFPANWQQDLGLLDQSSRNIYKMKRVFRGVVLRIDVLQIFQPFYKF